MFVYAADVAHTARDAGRFGVDAHVDGVRWGDIVSRGRVPVVSVRNLVTFFTQLGMQFRAPAGDEDFEFKDEDFDDGGEVW